MKGRSGKEAGHVLVCCQMLSARLFCADIEKRFVFSIVLVFYSLTATKVCFHLRFLVYVLYSLMCVCVCFAPD